MNEQLQGLMQSDLSIFQTLTGSRQIEIASAIKREEKMAVLGKRGYQEEELEDVVEKVVTEDV